MFMSSQAQGKKSKHLKNTQPIIDEAHSTSTHLFLLILWNDQLCRKIAHKVLPVHSPTSSQLLRTVPQHHHLRVVNVAVLAFWAGIQLCLCISNCLGKLLQVGKFIELEDGQKSR